MSSNLSTITDEDGDYSDWIELYNAGSTAISLDNIYFYLYLNFSYKI